MNAATSTEQLPEPIPEHDPPEPASLSIVGHGATLDAAGVERTILRDAIVGAVLGAIICAPLWALLAVIALRNSDTALMPPVAIAASVGVLAGVFLGGSTGTLVGSKTLEHFERGIRPNVPHTD